MSCMRANFILWKNDSLRLFGDHCVIYNLKETFYLHNLVERILRNSVCFFKIGHASVIESTFGLLFFHLKANDVLFGSVV